MSKKRKKKSLKGDISVPNIVKKAGNSFWKYAMVAVGLGVGIWALKKAPKTNIEFMGGVIDKLLPGFSAFGLAWWLSTQTNEYAKNAAWGVGGAGAVDILRKMLGDKFPSLTDMLPAFNGVPLQGRKRRLFGVPMQGQASPVNTGDFPPSYYFKNAFQGLSGRNAYALGNSAPYALGAGNPNSMAGRRAYAMN